MHPLVTAAIDARVRAITAAALAALTPAPRPVQDAIDARMRAVAEAGIAALAAARTPLVLHMTGAPVTFE
jgi:hypothetical protein